MAVAEKKKAEPRPPKPIIDVGAKHTEADILALDERGYQLRFDERHFQVLSEAGIAALGHANQRDYFIALGASKALAKAGKRKELGFEGLEIPTDPLRSRPHSKLLVRNKLPGWHYCWKRPDEVEEAKSLGYLVDAEAEVPNATRTSKSAVIAAKDGKDDLVLMRVPEPLYQQHLHANAILSRQRAGATIKEISGMVRKAAAATGDNHLAGVPLPGLRESTTEEEVPIREDMAAAGRAR